MKDLTTTTVRPTVANLRAGNVVRAGYVRGQRDMTDANRFVGFKVGELVYSNLKLLKQAFGVSNLKDLEFESDRLDLGTITAEFYDTEDQFFWGAYLWEGSFRVGTSADKLTLKSA